MSIGKFGISSTETSVTHMHARTHTAHVMHLRNFGNENDLAHMKNIPLNIRLKLWNKTCDLYIHNFYLY